MQHMSNKQIITTNRKCGEYVSNKQAFKANNLSAEWSGAIYVVYSYGHYPILAYVPRIDAWYFNYEKYSVTTSKHLTQARRELLVSELPVATSFFSTLTTAARLAS